MKGFTSYQRVYLIKYINKKNIVFTTRKVTFKLHMVNRNNKNWLFVSLRGFKIQHCDMLQNIHDTLFCYLLHVKPLYFSDKLQTRKIKC